MAVYKPLGGRQCLSNDCTSNIRHQFCLYRSALNRRQSRSPVVASASPDDAQNDDLADVTKRLNDLFYQPVAVPASSVQPNAQDPSPSEEPGLLYDVPLWRVQWSILPGYQEVLHVHVPHYAAMFSALFRGPRPWRFGHLLLPEGSQNLGNPEYALKPGTKAPIIGSLLEVVQAVNFPDGRILLLCIAVGRFKVVESLQTVPYSRANIAMLPDAEEVAHFEALATRGLDTCDDVPLMAALEASTRAARAAAIAWSDIWADYEVSGCRVHEKLSLIDQRDATTAQQFGRRLIEIGSKEVLPLAFTVQGGSLEEDRSMHDVIHTSEMAAKEAIDQVVERLTGKKFNTTSAISSDGAAQQQQQSMFGPRDVLNTTVDRGIPSTTASQAAGVDVDRDMELPESLPSALILESAVWAELESIQLLAQRLNKKEPPPLPDGLLSIMPIDITSRSTTKEQQKRNEVVKRALDGYPDLRRVQRLSFVLCTVLPDVTVHEGRQAMLEAGSITARLKLGLACLRKQRKILAALLALEDGRN